MFKTLRYLCGSNLLYNNDLQNLGDILGHLSFVGIIPTTEQLFSYYLIGLKRTIIRKTRDVGLMVELTPEKIKTTFFNSDDSLLTDFINLLIYIDDHTDSIIEQINKTIDSLIEYQEELNSDKDKPIKGLCNLSYMEYAEENLFLVNLIKHFIEIKAKDKGALKFMTEKIRWKNAMEWIIDGELVPYEYSKQHKKDYPNGHDSIDCCCDCVGCAFQDPVCDGSKNRFQRMSNRNEIFLCIVPFTKKSKEWWCKHIGKDGSNIKVNNSKTEIDVLGYKFANVHNSVSDRNYKYFNFDQKFDNLFDYIQGKEESILNRLDRLKLLIQTIATPHHYRVEKKIKELFNLGN